MNYELAKELLDAGFPQGGSGSWMLPTDALVARRSDRVYVPTLSELIESCGDLSINVGRHKTGSFPDDKRFYATAIGITVFGATLDEAAARLWLALNNPKKI
jgi:hypothetical protein